MVLTQSEYRDYCERYRVVWKYLKMSSYPEDIVITSLCTERGYDEGRMGKTLRGIGFAFVDQDSFNFEKIRKLDRGDLGITNSKGKFLLSGRYILPVKDMLGNIIALIGWQGQSDRKYVTTPSRLFSKECLFYGMEQIGKVGIGKPCILVEGIFDSISVRSLGLNCYAMMGISVSRYKTEMYSLFGKMLAIPDCDTEGRKVIRDDTWQLPSRGKYLNWSGAGATGIKDIDDFVKSFDGEEVRELLLSAYKEPDRVVNVRLE